MYKPCMEIITNISIQILTLQKNKFLYRSKVKIILQVTSLICASHEIQCFDDSIPLLFQPRESSGEKVMKTLLFTMKNSKT